MDADDDHDAQLHAAAQRLARAIRQCVNDGLTIEEISQVLGLPADEIERLHAFDVSDQT